MSHRLETAFATAAEEGRAALIPFVTIGHPSVEATVAIVQRLADEGADVIELGIPFSDPLAEGPTIQKSSQHALERGVTPRLCLETISAIRALRVETPLVLMGYYNSILSYGLERFSEEATEAGVDGLIVVDLPYEEAGPLLEQAAPRGLSIIPLVALTSPSERIRKACENATGFVYCVSVLGVTGARAAMSDRVRDLVTRVREHTTLPVCVGFGISTADHVRQVAEFADGAIVGSALVAAIGDEDVDGAPERAGEFLRGLRQGVSVE